MDYLSSDTTPARDLAFDSESDNSHFDDSNGLQSARVQTKGQ